MWSSWWLIPLSVVGGLVLIWLALIVALWLSKPDGNGIRDAIRLLPDLVRLLKRLAADPEMPRGVRVRLVLLTAYLALPIDIIPDFVPVLGYADDAIVVALVLRSVTRLAGPDALDRHWAGTPDGLAALRRLCRLPDPR
ncbi:YkvA family protein [Mycobacterium sp. URHB0021]